MEGVMGGGGAAATLNDNNNNNNNSSSSKGGELDTTTAVAAGGADNNNNKEQQRGGLDAGFRQQLNLDSIKTRAISLYKSITHIINDLSLHSTTATTSNSPKWQELLGQFSMVNLELFNIVEDITKASKSFIVLPKSVNADNATVLPVMLSSKLLPEMETEDNAKRDLLLHPMHNLPVRVKKIGEACESAEKVITDTRKAYFGSRQGLNTVPTLDKVQAAKIQQQETLLRNAVNHGEGLRVQGGDQRQNNSALPLHLVDVLPIADSGHSFPDASSMYLKANAPLLSSNNINSQGNLLQATGTQQLSGRAVGSSASGGGGGGGMSSFDNMAAASPMQYANSPARSGTTNVMMNTPSPQQQQQSQQQFQQQQQQIQQQQQQQLQRQKIMQAQQAQQQQFRQASLSALGGQMHGQHQIQYSSAMGTQQFQGRQMPTGVIQHGISQGSGQVNQGNQLNRHQLNQFANSANNANSALFNAAQNSANPQMISNISANMSSQSVIPRMQQQQFGLSSGNRTHGSQILGDQMFNMGAGAANPGNMIPMQQQQQVQQGGSLGSMPQNSPQNMQSNMGALQQNHPNFHQQRQQSQP